jgi:hypothetical protein
MFGLPGQSRDEVERSVDFVLDHGATPRLTEYSPLPGTALWPDACRAAALSGHGTLEDEPLLTNNSVFYRMTGEFTDDWLQAVRHRIREAKA